MREVKLEAWLARDKELGDGNPGELIFYKNKPERDKSWWKGRDMGLDIDDHEFPEIKWEGEPIKCVITITTTE